MKTITLREKVTLGDQTYEKLELREPKAKELRQAAEGTGGNNVALAINLISILAKVPRAVVDELCQRDFTEVSDYVGGFTPDSPGTGNG